MLKLFEIKNKFSGMVVFSIEAKSFELAIIAAIEQNADLRFADLRNANLRSANLSNADLRSANLYNADLHSANLDNADLRFANLSNANLDFASWNLSCKTFNVKAGDRLVAQLFCHWAHLDVSQCSGTIRYMHRFIIGTFGKSMANWFCKYRDDVKEI